MRFVTSVDGMSWLLTVALEAGVLLVASWLGATLLRRSTAAARHQMWTLGAIGALVVPVLCWVAPSLMPSSSAEAAPLAGSVSFDLTAQVAAERTAPAWPLWLALAWASGMLVASARVLRGQLAAHRLVRSTESWVPDVWTDALQAATSSLELTRPVELLRSHAITSPMTIGLLRARVLLPAAAETWSSARLRAVLVHELGHVRRHDTLAQLVAQMACALYWWNPLAWYAAARMRIEREYACDDLVLETGTLPSSYAGDLLEVARSLSRDARVHVGASCMVERSGTEQRLRRILDANAPRRSLRMTGRMAMIGLTLACIVTIACTSSAPPVPPVPSTATLSPRISVGQPYLRNDIPMPPTSADIDLSGVASVVKDRLGALEQCYERQLATNPTLSGTVEIHWVILTTGKVADACIVKDTVANREITECVNKLVLEGQFPAPQLSSVDVMIPFVFTPRAI